MMLYVYTANIFFSQYLKYFLAWRRDVHHTVWRGSGRCECARAGGGRRSLEPSCSNSYTLPGLLSPLFPRIDLLQFTASCFICQSYLAHKSYVVAQGNVCTGEKGERLRGHREALVETV